MRILAIGDVTDQHGVDHLKSSLWDFRRKNAIDMAIVNGENAGFITGPSPEQTRMLLSSGADVVTGGNHTLHNSALCRAIDDLPGVIRPANFPDAPGYGYTFADAAGYRVLVINLIGRVMMQNTIDCPFRTADMILDAERGKYDLSVIDFHAEATGEKVALGRYLDGRVTAVFGTHTHVPTADEQVLDGGTGYISDIGMCGCKNGIIGIGADSVIRRYLSGAPVRLEAASGEVAANGVIFDIDMKSGRTVSVTRVVF